MDGHCASWPLTCVRRGGASLLLLCGLALAGCMPDIGTDPVPEAMEFDPTTGRVPQPTLLVINPATGRIDMSLAGIVVPADCLAQEAMPVAQCEFYQYLQSLDGYPTTAGATAPATAALDAATLTAANVAVVDLKAGKAFTDVTLGFSAAANNLTIDPKSGWDVGTTYVGAVRGYAGGVKAADGKEVVGSSVMYLLKEPTSLMCGAATPAEIPASCGYLVLLTQQMPDAEARDTLVTLEAARQVVASLGIVAAMADAGGIPGDQQAVVWAFPVHSASVIELDPTKGLLPQVVGTTGIRLKVKGAVDPATVTPWSMDDNTGTVFLLDLTALAANDLGGGLPAFTASYADGVISIEADADLPDGHTLATLVTTGVKNPDGVALVAPPITVLLKAQGPLTDAQGKSQVSDVSDADAASLEAGRKDFATLLDDELFAGLTGLNRADLAYVYAFDFPNP